MIDGFKLLSKLADPKNLLLAVQVIKMLKDVIEMVLRLVKTMTNGNSSVELQDALAGIPDLNRTKTGE